MGKMTSPLAAFTYFAKSHPGDTCGSKFFVLKMEIHDGLLSRLLSFQFGFLLCIFNGVQRMVCR